MFSLARFGSQPCDIGSPQVLERSKFSRTHSFEPSDPSGRKQRARRLRALSLPLCPLAREARFLVAPAVTRIPVALGALARKPAARWCAVCGRDSDNNGNVQTEVSDSPSAEDPRLPGSVINLRRQRRSTPIHVIHFKIVTTPFVGCCDSNLIQLSASSSRKSLTRRKNWKESAFSKRSSVSCEIRNAFVLACICVHVHS